MKTIEARIIVGIENWKYCIVKKKYPLYIVLGTSYLLRFYYYNSILDQNVPYQLNPTN